MILLHPTKVIDTEFSSAGEIGGYNLSNNKIVTFDIDVTIILTGAPGNGTIGRGRFTVFAHRYGGDAIIDSQYTIVPLETPGNLVGSSIAFNVSGARILATFTPPAGRTVMLMSTINITTAQD